MEVQLIFHEFCVGVGNLLSRTLLPSEIYGLVCIREVLIEARLRLASLLLGRR